MTKGTFKLISESYQNAAKRLFEYCSKSSILLRPFLYLYAIIAFVFLYSGSFIFYILIIFDLLAQVVTLIRKRLLLSIEYRAMSVKKSFVNFIFNPILIAVLAPLFIISTIVPKISSELEIDEVTGEMLKKMRLSGRGTFRQIMDFCSHTISNLFGYIGDNHFLLWIILIVPCLFNSFLMLVLLFVSLPLLVFDFVSYIVDEIRILCVRISINLGNSVENGFFSFIVSPLILLVLVPVFLFVLIIPKFSTGMDGEA